MKKFSIGGVHPPENKLGRKIPIQVMELPKRAYIPLGQHIGAPATAIVAKGDMVVTGQLIAEATGFMSANIHSSVTGKVFSVGVEKSAQGLSVPTIVIDRAEEEIWAEEIDTTAEVVRVCDLEPIAILDRIKAAGIVGMGGATFPTHVKLSIPPQKRAESLIINGAECEPYLTSDHRSMLERGEEFMIGVSLLMRVIGVANAYVGIESNKPDAIEKLTELANDFKGVEVVPLKVQYPQGGEKQLIEAITGREVPPPPGLPIDVGAVVVNVSTAIAVYEAVQKRKPLIERVVTVSGKSSDQPLNMVVRFGTPISALLERIGGLPDDTGKVINGGPMMGRAMVNLDSPVTKGCSGITIVAVGEAERAEESPCLKCGKCVSACPMSLEPYLLSKLMKRGAMEQLEERNVTDCIECGSCQFTCPAKLPLLDYIRLGKQRVMGIIRARSMNK
ncbi:MAG: electron transport complex subunit RsxC [Rikenellaceae bacterium]